MKQKYFMSWDDDDDDNMRGWDPASEDDTHDNGMGRWSENNDEKGWNQRGKREEGGIIALPLDKTNKSNYQMKVSREVVKLVNFITATKRTDKKEFNGKRYIKI